MDSDTQGRRPNHGPYAHPGTSNAFTVLSQGLTFDREKYGREIDIFERCARAAADARAATDAGGDAGGDAGTRGERQKSEADDVQGNDPWEKANVIRKRNKIKVNGSAPPAPITSFDDVMELDLDDDDDEDREAGARRSVGGDRDATEATKDDQYNTKRLVRNITSFYGTPTPVQKQAVPCLNAGRELMVVAPTGSGKTLAFLIPLVMRVKRQKVCAARRGAAAAASGVRAVVISPTKELSTQTGRVLMPLLPGLKLRCSVLSKATAAGCDFDKVDILLANPLRLDAMAREGKIDLSNVETLVLDEADKLFEMGFAEQIDACLASCTNENIVRALFSATLPETVEQLARSVLRDPLRVTVGERNVSATSVEQKLLFVGREDGKLLGVRQLLADGVRPPVLIFVNTKDRAKEVHRELMFDGVHVDSLHASQGQAAREKAVEKFREGKTWVLIATDLVARGLDFAGVETVVNFDFPNSTLDYIHRVGRTGRAGRTGKAVTFFTEDDVDRLRGVANVIKASGGRVDDWMLKLKKVRNRNRDRRARASSADLVSGDDDGDGTGEGSGGKKQRQSRADEGGKTTTTTTATRITTMSKKKKKKKGLLN